MMRGRGYKALVGVAAALGLAVTAMPALADLSAGGSLLGNPVQVTNTEPDPSISTQTPVNGDVSVCILSECESPAAAGQPSSGSSQNGGGTNVTAPVNGNGSVCVLSSCKSPAAGGQGASGSAQGPSGSAPAASASGTGATGSAQATGKPTGSVQSGKLGVSGKSAPRSGKTGKAGLAGKTKSALTTPALKGKAGPSGASVAADCEETSTGSGEKASGARMESGLPGSVQGTALLTGVPLMILVALGAFALGTRLRREDSQ